MSGVSTALATTRAPWRDGSSSGVTANGSGYSMSPRTIAWLDRRALSRSRASEGSSGVLVRTQPSDLGGAASPAAPHPRRRGQPAAEQDAADHDEDRQQRAGDGELQHRQRGRHLGRRLPGGAGQPPERVQVLGDVGRRDQQDAADAPAGDPPGARAVQEEGPEAEHPHPGQHVAGDQETVRLERDLVDAPFAVELPPAQVQQGSAHDDGQDGQDRQRGPGTTGGTNPHDLPAPPQTPTGRARLAQGSPDPSTATQGWPLD
jgi:hypothetical protein